MNENEPKPKDAGKNGATPKKNGKLIVSVSPDELEVIMSVWLLEKFVVNASGLADFVKSDGELVLTFEVKRGS